MWIPLSLLSFFFTNNQQQIDQQQSAATTTNNNQQSTISNNQQSITFKMGGGLFSHLKRKIFGEKERSPSEMRDRELDFNTRWNDFVFPIDLPDSLRQRPHPYGVRFIHGSTSTIVHHPESPPPIPIYQRREQTPGPSRGL